MTTRVARPLLASWLLVAALVATAVTAVAPTPAGAEIDDGPTTWWGVDTLLTGTQNDSIRSYVFAIEQVGDRIYVGGRFGDITHEGNLTPQPYLAAFDATTGIWIDTFTPALNGSVNALQASPDGERLFVGGDFTTVNGQTAETLVALDPTTGAVDPTFDVQLTSSTVVRDFDLEGQWLYVVGGFNGVVSPIGNNLSTRATRIDWITGNHDPSWRPMVSGGTPWGVAASSDADRVYLAGDFTSVDGADVIGGFAAVTASEATYVPPAEPFPVNTTKIARQYLYDVEVVNGYVFAGGSEHFVAVLNESDQSLHRFHYTRPKGDYQDLEVVGDRVYAGCHCRADAVIDSATDVIWFSTPPAGAVSATPYATYDNTWVTAFSAIDGEVEPTFVPPITANRAGVWAIHGAADGCLWLGGDITGNGGVPASNLIRLCDSAAVDTERPSVPGAPTEVAQTATSIDLTWNPSTDDVGVAGYQVHDGATGEIVATSSSNAVTVTGVSGSVSFYVKAFDAAGNTSWRSGIRTFDVVGDVDTERPTPPTGLRLEGTDLVWNPSTDDTGVTGYHVYDAADGSIVATTGQTTMAVADLPAGITVFVKAFDAAGNTSWRSNTVPLP